MWNFICEDSWFKALGSLEYIDLLIAFKAFLFALFFCEKMLQMLLCLFMKRNYVIALSYCGWTCASMMAVFFSSEFCSRISD